MHDGSRVARRQEYSYPWPLNDILALRYRFSHGAAIATRFVRYVFTRDQPRNKLKAPGKELDVSKRLSPTNRSYVGNSTWQTFYEGKVVVEMIPYFICARVCVCYLAQKHDNEEENKVFALSLRSSLDMFTSEMFTRVRVSSFRKENQINKQDGDRGSREECESRENIYVEEIELITNCCWT